MKTSKVANLWWLSARSPLSDMEVRTQGFYKMASVLQGDHTRPLQYSLVYITQAIRN